uniref:Isoleucine--tRNA ligase, cytoplasmic n=1 Tax=Strigamia maritima TaxID=126957 RepID=T1J3R6_STRMM
MSSSNRNILNMVQPVAEKINFALEEEDIIKLWTKLDAFRTSLKQSKGKPRFTFYDGPPFATGLPHYGHILAGTIKDIITRFAHQSGFHVERRFGWDCHGLPVEYEIDKTLGIKGPEDVMKVGIANYNAECRKIVMRYAEEWKTVIGRLGRWIDFDNDYKTMYPTFMETVWWTFKQLFDKGLVYRGFKVMPYSTACNTPLSNFESGQNYKDVVDPAVIVGFPLTEDANVSMIAWTTTPWTLPSNLALCVHPDKIYVKLEETKSKKIYIMMEARLEALYKNEADYKILEKFPGSKLQGKTYTPLFDYYANRKKKGSFKIVCDTYVTEESGTGVVHQACYFGEDDYRVGLANGIINKNDEMVCPVDESGRFTAPVTHFKGQYVKDADKHIIQHLKEKNRLVNESSVKHSYPFCWRSETPLIYKAVPSWFIRVEDLVERLMENNQKTYWVPEFVKEKRFGNWLRDARDWAVSRNRYWGTPIPLWMSDDGQEIVCVGSIEELKQLSGVELKDLHRENVDKITIPSIMGKGVLKRVPEVFDCWFESGSMPYAQVHYPFENKNEFEDAFPADFIAEGIDQTRGWFYTLLVVSTALFGKPPFKNLIANGLVLASDGQKMSKRKKNYPDPMTVVNQYGSDALRLYLINSPAVRGDNLKFKEEGVRDILKDVFLPWYNAYRFFIQNVELLNKEENVQFEHNEAREGLSENIMDRWILSCTQSLLSFVRHEMKAYRLYTVVPHLIKFIDNLTNWYVRFNRKRLKGENGKIDCQHALQTLSSVLFALIKIMAPFTPFLTEMIYQNMRNLLPESEMSKSESASVHYLMLPETKKSLIDVAIERAVSKMQTVIDLGRIIRDRRTLPVKYPVQELIIIHKDEIALQEIRTLKTYILEELNVKVLTTTTDKNKYGVEMRAEPEHKTLGIRLRGDFKKIWQAIKELHDNQIQQYLLKGSINIMGYDLGPEDLRIMYTLKSSQLSEKFEADAKNDVLVMLDVSPDPSLVDEGMAREVINRAHLVPTDPVIVYYNATPSENLHRIIRNFQDYIESTTKAPMKLLPLPANSTIITNELQQLKGVDLDLTIVGGPGYVPRENKTDVKNPFCRFVNVEYCGIESLAEVQLIFGINKRKVDLMSGSSILKANIFNLHGKTLRVGVKGQTKQEDEQNDHQKPHCRFINVELEEGKIVEKGTVLLENPQNHYVLDFDGFRHQVESVFGLQNKKFKLFNDSKKSEEMSTNGKLLSFEGKVVYAKVFN